MPVAFEALIICGRFCAQQAIEFMVLETFSATCQGKENKGWRPRMHIGADKYVSGGGGPQAEKLRPLLKLMQFIGAVSGGKSVAQVSLNYLRAQGKHSTGH